MRLTPQERRKRIYDILNADTFVVAQAAVSKMEEVYA